jgi:hypothetical protein
MNKYTIKSLPSFYVIGKEGDSKEGPSLVENLWNKADNHIKEVASLIKMDEYGPSSYWGLMSDYSRGFHPWEHGFKDGLYLAGYEAKDINVTLPAGWSVWKAPEATYLIYPVGDDYSKSFAEGLAALKEEGYDLAGAVYDHAEKGENFLYFPVKKIKA